MKANGILTTLVLVLTLVAVPVNAQKSLADRAATREQLSQLLARHGSRDDVNIVFRPSRSNEWNFSGTRTTGLTYSDSLEVIAAVGDRQTLSFMVYPRYKGNYIGIERARDSMGLMRHLLELTNETFFYWGVDTDGDVFCGFNFTLESGFPSEAILVVLSSIENMDRYVGELRPFIDGPGRK